MPVVAVFDTNVLLSAVLSLTGKPFRCVAQARLGMVESVTCEELLDEFREKLRDKLGFPDDKALVAADEVRAISRVVAISAH